MADQCHGFATQHALLRNEVSYNVMVSGVTTDESCRSSTIRGSIAALWRASRSVAWHAASFAVMVTLAS
jgi:hypothetical protein